MTKIPDNQSNNSQIILYLTEDGHTRLEVRLDGKTAWLTQALMAELFQTTKQNISLHLQNIYDERELDHAATVKKYLTVQKEGEREIQRNIDYYNLDAILAVGYRVRSSRGTQFRQWATGKLREYLVKGFVMDDERLKEGRHIGTDYFDELLERIRDIRASEKRFYQKIRDIYALSIDYDPKAEVTKEFFQVVQNKLHWAITGLTAAELIEKRADASKPNMGLTAWKGAKVRRKDVVIAKNYLQENELRQLNRLVTMYLDYAETQAERQQPLYMKDWREKLDGFLKFNQRDILENPGRISMEVAQKLALEKYEQFNRKRLNMDAEKEVDEFEKKSAEIARTIKKQLSKKSSKRRNRSS